MSLMQGETYGKMRVTVFDGLQLEKKVSGKPGWKVNGTRLLGQSSGKSPGAKEQLKR